MFVNHRCSYLFIENIISIIVSILSDIGYENEIKVICFFTNNVTLSVIDKLITLIGCLGFWLFLQNLICVKYRRTWVFMKINETEKSTEIRSQVYKSYQNTLIPSSQKTCHKSFKKVFYFKFYILL